MPAYLADSHSAGASAATTVAVQLIPAGATRRQDAPAPAACKP